ncbi:unnamed protein product [Didymodactylos carnosus]|uniref:C2H2-type domain-containing protein n=1 Tax=Didymodactylos carnosus TaxID=1234261 RepID=A0A813QK63_9BILA|nr:unnamed protein product [Didymodactylos carnosus]CAF0867521.1 unnamed protein product [Didymodactylos carnosus]CAF3550509.1 unnamed protein product [Didymodactylos carnosus]CAF3652331.1 unnamed protein product [Didymodactylos carnosus]
MSSHAYVEHLDIRHREEEVEVTCPLCAQIFTSVGRFKTHMRKQHYSSKSTSSSQLSQASSSTIVPPTDNDDIDEASLSEDEDLSERGLVPAASRNQGSYFKRPRFDNPKLIVSGSSRANSSSSSSHGFLTSTRMKTKNEPEIPDNSSVASNDHINTIKEEFQDNQHDNEDRILASERRGTLYSPGSMQDDLSSSTRIYNRTRCYPAVPMPPQLPEFSEKVLRYLDMGNAAPILPDLISEAADFFMKTYPQLKTGREYHKVGLALIKKYPCLAEKGNQFKPENEGRIHQNDDAYYESINIKLRQIQGQPQFSTLYKQYLSKTHTRRREWLSLNADLNLYGILQELPFMAGKEFLTGEYGLLHGRHISSFNKVIGQVLDVLTNYFSIRLRENMDITYRLTLMQLCQTLNCNYIIQNKQGNIIKSEPDNGSYLRLTVMDFVNGTSSYFLFYGRKPLCELATGQGILRQALLLFLITFEVYMVDIPDDYYEALSLLRIAVFGDVYEGEVPETEVAQKLLNIIHETVKQR